MRFGACLVLSVLALVATGWPERGSTSAHTPQAGKAVAGVQWIWLNEGDPVVRAPTESRYFRKAFDYRPIFDAPAEEATLEITAAGRFTAWLNGVRVGAAADPKRVHAFDVRRPLRPGRNVLTVEAHSTAGPAGLVARLSFVPNGASRVAVVSDGSWKVSRKAGTGWQKVDFDDSAWSAARVLGPFGKDGPAPWRDVAWEAGDGRFSVPAGFAVEAVVPEEPASRHLDPKRPFSLLNLTFDARGRLLVSQERGPVLLCTDPGPDGVLRSVRPYCEQVRGCQGMCWVGDALFLVGDGPQGTGLYRCRDTKKADKIDEVTLLHKFVGGMGEHGPHAVLHGLDGLVYLVVGNGAWARPARLSASSPLTRWSDGQQGPDQGKPGTTEDVLLPRVNDPRDPEGKALAPGGTVWRLDRAGKDMALIVAGLRNAYDAAFSPSGELFTFDSDMEWDEGLPWYRPVRVCHCPPGADFLWRIASANTPDYYLDSLPPLLETGRGSPTGLEFYDHHAFPERYRGALFMADWALGIIYAVHLKRDGASHKGTLEKFCTGAPMNVTDLAVGPDGALYFCLGGRGSRGSVFRIVYRGKEAPAAPAGVDALLAAPQPLVAWSRAKWEPALAARGVERDLTAAARSPTRPVRERVRALDLLQARTGRADRRVLLSLLADREPEVRAHAVWLLGNTERAGPEVGEALARALKDRDALVRRRAGEALVRAGIEPPVKALWPLLAEDDRFVRTAARLVLQRIDPEKWAGRLWKEKCDLVAWEGIVALCKSGRAAPHAGELFARLNRLAPDAPAQALLDQLRTVQLALVHTTRRPAAVKEFAEQAYRLFPHRDRRVSRELAVLLTYFRKEGLLDRPVVAKLVNALEASAGDRPQQIHYFYCLRLLHEGWTAAQKDRLLAWYDATATWTGGHSFTAYLEQILREAGNVFSAEDLRRVLARGERMPWAATALLRLGPGHPLPAPAELASLYRRVLDRGEIPRGEELKEAIVSVLGQDTRPAAQAALRRIGDSDHPRHAAVALALARSPSPENWPHLVRGLRSSSPVVLREVMTALRKLPTQSRIEDPTPYRALLLAAARLPDAERRQAVELLRHWGGGRRFGAEGDAKAELAAWARWFAQTFPREPALPDTAASDPARSKHRFEELLAFLERDPAGRRGDATRGRQVYEKAQCVKCHRFGKEGEGVGPDLTAVSKRFNRADILEAIVYPSKAISDQYRSSVIVTKGGRQFTGLVTTQGRTVMVLLPDATRVTLRKDEVEEQYASLVSVMPEGLLDPLTRQEIADLFAFLESGPR